MVGSSASECGRMRKTNGHPCENVEMLSVFMKNSASNCNWVTLF